MTFMRYNLEEMIPKDHAFRKFKKWLAVEEVVEDLEELKKGLGREGYGYEVGLRALFLQFYGDHSDREMEEQLKYNMLYRWYCGFEIEGEKPDHTYFCRVRKALGAERISKLFDDVVKKCGEKNLLKGVDVFIDASAIKRKEATWKERDKAKADGKASQSNAVISDYASDKEAKWGCKKTGKYWFGYKQHVCMEMDSRIISGLQVTPGNVSDDDGFGAICPRGKHVLADKGYDSWKVKGRLEKEGCENGIIQKNAKTEETRARNKELSKRRAPGEGVFSHMSRRTRYMGTQKTLAQMLWEGMIHNLKRMWLLEQSPGLVTL